MKKEYDFSQAERGRFYDKNASCNRPIYLDEQNQAFVEEIARRKQLDVSAVVNQLIRSDRELPRAVE